VLVGNGSSGRGLCCWPAPTPNNSHRRRGLTDLAPAATETPSKWTDAGARCCGGSPGPLLGPPAGAQQQEVASSALCECGSGAARRRALRGPCLWSKPPGKKKKTRRGIAVSHRKCAADIKQTDSATRGEIAGGDAHTALTATHSGIGAAMANPRGGI
jgi:hypothetical protein